MRLEVLVEDNSKERRKGEVEEVTRGALQERMIRNEPPDRRRMDSIKPLISGIESFVRANAFISQHARYIIPVRGCLILNKMY